MPDASAANTNLDPRLTVHGPPHLRQHVVVGCPLPAARVPGNAGPALVLEGPDGTRLPLQSVPLTPVTSTGLRWCELSFLAPGPGDYTLHDAPAAPSAHAAPLATRAGADCVLDNGLVRVTLQGDAATGPAVLHLHSGRLSSSLTPQVTLAPGRLAQDSVAAAQPRELRLLRNGPLRAQAELIGQLTDGEGEPALAYRLTVEMWADTRAVRVDWMIINQLPGQPTAPVETATLAGSWQVGGGVQRRFIQPCHSPYYKPRTVLNPDPVTIIADHSGFAVHIADRAMLLDDTHYLPYLLPGTQLTSDWLALQGDAGAVVATLADFAASRPNALASHANRLDYQFIPPGHDTAWPQGRRREQTLLLSFADATGAAAGPDLAPALAAMQALQPGLRAQPTPQTLKALGCFDIQTVFDGGPDTNVRLSMLMRQACMLQTPADKWDLGDTPDSGYSSTYAGSPDSFMPHPALGDITPGFSTDGHLFPATLTNWVEPVWTNNEYDIIHGLAVELMRTGRQEHARMLRWTVRHHVEVDFVVYSDDPAHHRAVPFHSHHHNTKGAIPSHFWTQGLLQYYCLTGDRDAHEMAIALGDKIIHLINHDDAFTWHFDREIGWALLALVCLVEAGHGQYRAECDRAAGYLMDYDRAAFTGAVKLSSGRADRGLVRQLLDNAFGYVSIIEGMDRYQKISGSEAADAWLRQLLVELKAAFWDAVREVEVPELFRLSTHILAIGYERTGDPDFIRAALVVLDGYFARGLTDNHQYRALGQVKPSAMFLRSLGRFLGHAQRLGLLERYELPSLQGLPPPHADSRE